MGVDYDGLRSAVLSLTEGESDAVALMATVACEVHHGHPFSDWTGFYRVVAPELLKIGPYQGGHGCLVIPFSRGVCGACARTGKVMNVPDVDAFPDHIACASSTRSELVLPVWNGAGVLLGVFDLDSNTPAAFTAADEAFFTALLADVFRDAA
ncbi:GAF domain-containing protein [Pseudotabrizicola formosa]|uniref:GAF domain-containing protein n=1 Tax=Pseudotabrizicola formosa TaxID=2030009 RepID=UPI000CCFFD40|nr:GAF domain-containing protein [Pseudotabrizicola formosa]